MSQTTSHVNACSIRLWIDDATGTLTNVSGSSNSASLSLTRALGSLQTFEGDWDIVTACKISGSVSLGGVYTMDNGEARDIVEEWIMHDGGGQLSRTIRIEIPTKDGSYVGGISFQGEAVIESYEFPLDASSADPIAWSANVRLDGQLVRDTISAS